MTIKEISKAVSQRKMSFSELTKFYLGQIKKLEPKINAFITLFEKEAIKQSERADKKFSSGQKLWPLEGIPCAIKDNILIKGTKTTCASKILEGYFASYNARVIEELKKNGACFLGKTNMDEFAMGSSTETSAFGLCRNPWDLSRVPGGSSGGSAAAVASEEAVYALGSDTGGSIRQPAAFCGVVGLKPTYGRVSRSGLIAMASSLDQIGPITKTVEDAAWVFSIISGPDEQDSTCSTEGVPDLIGTLTPGIKGLRIGVPKEYFGPGIDKEVGDLVKKAIKEFEEMGAKIEEMSLPHTEYALACYYIIMPAEVSANLARYDGIRYGLSKTQNHEHKVQSLIDTYFESRKQGFGNEVKRRIMLGTFILSAGYYEAYYKKAQKVRTLICQDFRSAFDKFDLLLCPTTPTPPFKIGEKADDPLSMYMSDVLTVPASLAGIPALSIPCGFVKREGKKLPCGLQLMADYFNEKKMLEAAYAYELNTKWHKEKPDISSI